MKKAPDKMERIKKTFVLVFWLCVWQLAALLIDNRLLFAGPLDTLRALGREMASPDFLRTVCFSLMRILTGFIAAAFVGALLGALSFWRRALELLLSPVMQFCKAVPVAAFAVILLIWQGAGRLSAAVCFLVALPIVYVNVLEGLVHTDKKLLEMAAVFRIPFCSTFFYIYRPAMAPFLEGCLKTALGMGVKAGVAAEVIGLPRWSVGGEIYLSKIYLDTAGVFAWTAVVLALGVGLEKGVLSLWRLFLRWKPAPVNRGISVKKVSLIFENIEKSYKGRPVLSGVNRRLEAAGSYCLMAPSGAGKTTLLHMAAGLVRPDGGRITAAADSVPEREPAPLSASMVFQDDRLCEEESALTNVSLVCGSRERAAACLEKLLEKEAAVKPVKELSGGMRRLVCIARALAADSQALLLDEPFTGLDGETRKKAAEVILAYRAERLLLAATHDEADAERLRGEIWRLQRQKQCGKRYEKA